MAAAVLDRGERIAIENWSRHAAIVPRWQQPVQCQLLIHAHIR
jgi:hypothetical protein